MTNDKVISAMKNIALAGIGAGVTIVALFKGINSYDTMTVLISYYSYYGIHVYQSNKIDKVSDPISAPPK